MKNYRLTTEAEKDLREVARYTLKEWGQAMQRDYRDGLKKTFEAIGSKDVVGRGFSDKFPELLVAKFKHHFIFYLTAGVEKPSIIGVIHERRDIVRRLSERLS